MKWHKMWKGHFVHSLVSFLMAMRISWSEKGTCTKELGIVTSDARFRVVLNMHRSKGCLLLSWKHLAIFHIINSRVKYEGSRV